MFTRGFRPTGRRALPLLAAVAVLSGTATSAAAAERPPNDDVRDAVPVAALPTSVSLDIRGATVEPDEQLDACFETDHTVWYELTLPIGRQVQLDASGSDFDAGLVVFAGSAPEAELVACGVDRLTFAAQADVSYFVQVGAVTGLRDGQGWLDLTFRDAPRLTGKPTTTNDRVAARAALAAWEQELPGGRRLVQVSTATTREHAAPGRPTESSDVVVEIHDLVTDPTTGVLVHDEWFGLLTPSPGQLRQDPALRSAVVDAPVLLEHVRLVATPDGEVETQDLGVVRGSVSLTWTGQGAVVRDRSVTHERDIDERATFVGIEHVRAALVDGDVTIGGTSVIEGAPWMSYLLDGRNLSRTWSRTDH